MASSVSSHNYNQRTWPGHGLLTAMFLHHINASSKRLSAHILNSARSATQKAYAAEKLQYNKQVGNVDCQDLFLRIEKLFHFYFSLRR